MISSGRYGGIRNNLDDLADRLYAPNETRFINVKVSYMITKINK